MQQLFAFFSLLRQLICVGIWKDEHIAPIKRIVDFIHDQGSLAGVQIAHAGRKVL